jgi:prepilin-type N-terminal cleavage/methylation domain-containing protein
MGTGRSTNAFVRRDAFTIVELLIVITIVGILLSLLLPAVESSQEAARKTQCKNNLRQLALAATYHLDSAGYFPSGGWGYRWAGDPDRGFGTRQPGGWIYSILPYVEERTLWRAGAGINFTQNPTAKETALAAQVKQPIPILNCPSRRPPDLYPYSPQRAPINLNAADLIPGVVKTDYAISIGDTGEVQYPGPSSFADVDGDNYKWQSGYTGVSFQASQVTVPQITDGLSHTYLIGEKYLDATAYTNGADSSDNDAATQGFDNDMCRIASPDFPPKGDIPGEVNPSIFGSAHVEGFHMAFCDGSVHFIDYSIDPDVHAHLANRADGQSTTSNAIH